MSRLGFEPWVDLNYRLGHDPSVLGASEHILYVGSLGVESKTGRSG